VNTILIVIDTLRRDYLGCYGNKTVKTPCLDAFAEKSVVFDNAYLASSPCMPARREIITGRYEFPFRGWGPLEPQDHDLPAALRAGQWSEVEAERAAIPVDNATHGDRVQVEAGLRHLEILRGFLGEDVRGDVRCYEPGAGAGAALLEFAVPAATITPPARPRDAADTPELSP